MAVFNINKMLVGDSLKSKSIKINFIYNSSLRVFNIIFPLISFPYVARTLSPSSIGKFDFSFSIVQYFVLIAQAGIPTYAIRECSKHRDDKKKLTQIVTELFVINIIVSIFSYILFVLLILNLNSLKEYTTLLLVSSISIISTAFGMEWLFQSIEDYKYITIRSCIVKLISLIILLFWVKNENDYIKYALITVGSISISHLFNFTYANRFVNIIKKQKSTQLNLNKHIKPILILFFMTISVSIYVSLDKIMLGLFTGDSAVGFYSTANKLISVVLALVTSLGTILLPRISYYIQYNQKEAINNLIRKSLNFILMISIPLTVGIMVLAKPIILIIAGDKYIESITTLRILSPIVVLIAINNLIGIQILVSHGKEKLTMISTIIGAVVNFTINLLLIPSFKQNGAATATLIAETIVTLVQIMFAYKYIKNSISLKDILNFIIGNSLILIISIIFVINIKNSILCVLFSILLSAPIYFAYLYMVKNELVYEFSNKLWDKLWDVKKGIFK